MDFFSELAKIDDALGIPRPTIASDIVIPDWLRYPDASLKGWPYQRRYCWHCGSDRDVTGIGRGAACAGCAADIRREAEADREPPDEYAEDEA